MFATPSTDTAIMNAPDDKVGEASGIFKMASSLGNAFGVAISSTVFTTLSAVYTFSVGATIGILTTATFVLLSLLMSIFVIPSKRSSK